MNLKHLTDKTLLADTKRLAMKEGEITLEMLDHLREIERRKLYSDLGYSSLFNYTVKELGYDDASAIRRIKSARLIKEIPQIEKKVEEGLLSLTNLFMAANLFNTEDITDKKDKIEILEQIENTTKKECEQILAGFKTEPVIPREKEKQITSELKSLKINLSNSTVKKLDELKELLSHHRFNSDQLFNKIFDSAMVEIKNNKYKLNASNPALEPSPGVNTRYIAAAIKKAVFNRDKGQCTKCGSRKFLQYDHITPYSMGGKSTVENLRLLCSNCNQRSGIARGIINKAK